jgi:hypothetical protein
MINKYLYIVILFLQFPCSHFSRVSAPPSPARPPRKRDADACTASRGLCIQRTYPRMGTRERGNIHPRTYWSFPPMTLNDHAKGAL